jgi:hypothetical protein
MLNPDIFRKAASRLEQMGAREDRFFHSALACCPAITDTCHSANIGRGERMTYKAFFEEWFAPEDAEPDEWWWEPGVLMPRLIALDLAAEFCEDAMAVVQAKIDTINDKMMAVLGGYIGKYEVTSRTLLAMESRLTICLLGLPPVLKWLKLMVKPGTRDQIIPANLPTVLVLAGYANPNHCGHMDLQELGFLELFRTCTTPDGVRWNYDPEQGGDVTLRLPVPVNHVDITLEAKP